MDTTRRKRKKADGMLLMAILCDDRVGNKAMRAFDRNQRDQSSKFRPKAVSTVTMGIPFHLRFMMGRKAEGTSLEAHSVESSWFRDIAVVPSRFRPTSRIWSDGCSRDY